MPKSEPVAARKIRRNSSPHSSTAPISSTQSEDILDKFLLGLGATIRTFPDIEIAKLKLELSNVVFRKEVELAETRAQANIIPKK